jgi:hypothetical protein
MQATYIMCFFFVLKHAPVSMNSICAMNHVERCACGCDLDVQHPLLPRDDEHAFRSYGVRLRASNRQKISCKRGSRYSLKCDVIRVAFQEEKAVVIDHHQERVGLIFLPMHGSYELQTVSRGGASHFQMTIKLLEQHARVRMASRRYHLEYIRSCCSLFERLTHSRYVKGGQASCNTKVTPRSTRHAWRPARAYSAR